MEPINVEFEWKLSDYHEAQKLFLGAQITTNVMPFQAEHPQHIREIEKIVEIQLVET